jgi:hypothetical protein
MSGRADFIDAYLNEIHDEKTVKKLLFLKADLLKQLDEIDRSKPAQHANARFTKQDTSFVDRAINTAKDRNTNDAKREAMKIADPHIDDKKKFREIVKQHGPDEEKLKIQQEEEAELKESKAERKIVEPEIVEPEVIEPKIQNLTEEEQKAADIKLLREQFAKNSEMTKDMGR